MMNYIELINWFWTCDEVHSFDAKETRLYFYLLKVANSLHWQESFWHSDSKTAGNVGFTVNTLKSARNKLKNTGLIDFKNGGNGYGDKSRYQILTPNSYPKVEPRLIPKPQPNMQPKVEPLSKLKQKPNKKENINSKSHSENEFSVIEKIENLKPETAKPPEDLFYKKLVSVWFDFFQKQFSVKPTYGAIEGNKIKSIQKKLKSKCEEFQMDWNLENAEQSFNQFLEVAITDKWLKENFQLAILDSKFDSIIIKALKSTNAISKTTAESILDRW